MCIFLWVHGFYFSGIDAQGYNCWGFDSNFKLSNFFSSVEVLYFHQQCMSDPLFYSCLLAFSVIIVFRSHFDKCTVIYHCAISLHFPDGKWCWPSFHVLIWHFYPLQWNVSFSYLLPIFLIGLFLLWSFEILYII